MDRYTPGAPGKVAGKKFQAGRTFGGYMSSLLELNVRSGSKAPRLGRTKSRAAGLPQISK
jgi:hypothetical protein